MDIIPRIASLLGIDPAREPQFLWIAEHAAGTIVDPDEWAEFTTSKGQVLYYNKKSKKQKGFIDLVADASADHSHDVEHNGAELSRDIQARTELRLPATSPEILNQLCSFVKVDSCYEPFLCHVLKACFDTYAKKQYDIRCLLVDLPEPLDSLRRIEKEKVNVDVFSIPRSIIMCDECEKRSAVVKCEQCMDHFCQECFDELHATGNRRTHMTQEVEQLVCIACDATVADCQCVQCGSFFCSPCFVSIHGSRSDLNKHRKRNISGLVCLECEHAHATVICEDCVDLFCSACYLKLHKKGQRKKHAHLTVDPNGQVFRGGLIIPSAEAQSVIEAARSRSAYSHWIMFQTDGGESNFWCNVKTQVISNESPYGTN